MPLQKRLSKTLSLDEKIGQMLVVGFHGLEPPEHILRWLAEGRIGGVILFARNIENPKQVTKMTRACYKAAKYPILIAIDQEGGVVARLRKGFTESPGAMALGVANSEELALNVSTVLATEMKTLGINWNLAPAVDLTHNIHNPSVGVRSLGTNPERVAKLGVAQVYGFQRAGVAATAKHFPGKADTPVDPHVKLPVIDGSLDKIRETDLVPFKAVSEAGVAAMMITHVQFKALEPKYPSTLSPKIIQGLLRKELGFTGLVSTDCMEMKAVTDEYGPGESAVLAALAGANILFFSHTRESQEAAYNTLLEAVDKGRIPMEKIDYAIDRIQAVKMRFPITESSSLDIIRHPDHLAVMIKAARAGTVLLESKPGVLPIQYDDHCTVTLLEFASNLETKELESTSKTSLANSLYKELPQLESVWLDPSAPTEESIMRAHELASLANYVIVVTRNAHLNPGQLKAAQDFLNSAMRSILICLRNPYDAGVLTGAGAVICTCGDSAPSLISATEAIAGRIKPTAKLSVPLIMD